MSFVSHRSYRFLDLVSPEHEDIFKMAERAVSDDYGYATGSYPYIALCHDSFIKLVGKHLRKGMRVIDIGCGAGDKLAAFKALKKSLHITGLEYHPTMVALARIMCPFATVVEADAFKWDYSRYDLLYMYRPICDPFRQAQLQQCVMDGMRPGAILCVQYQEDYKSGFYPNHYMTPKQKVIAETQKFPNLKEWVKPNA